MAQSDVPDGYMQDAQGRLVPVTLVKPEHLLEDALVRELLRAGEKRSGELRAFKDHVRSEIGALLEVLAGKYKAPRGGSKGNITLTSFDGLLRIQIAIGDQLAFGPELQVAKTLVDECIRGWSQGTAPELQAIVNDAFNVDKKGKLNTDRILALRRLEIHDEKWQRAMAAISDAIRVERSKEYFRLYRRPSRDARWEQVPLDLASV